MIIVEHLRNVWNFAAFAHGAFHFYPREEWIDVSIKAGFELVTEISKTPFIGVFVLEKLVTSESSGNIEPGSRLLRNLSPRPPTTRDSTSSSPSVSPPS